MRIYFSGAHSTGKSSLARWVSEHYKLPMISETARMVLSEQELHVDTLRSNLEVANKFQRDVFERQLLEEERAKQGSFEGFVSDRCLLDILAYSAQHTTISSDLIKDKRTTEYAYNLRCRTNDMASIVFFVRPSKATLQDDGVREALNWDGIVAIDGMIKLLLEMYSVPYIQIGMDSMQERISIVRNVLDLIAK